MSLIPKGPHRGKVLVWNRYPVAVRPGAPYSTNWYACQAWSIVDPNPTAATRFFNYLLPMLDMGPTQPTLLIPSLSADLFCSGHAWSPYGDLVVAGGAKYNYTPGAQLPIVELGAKFLYMFDPSRVSAPFPVAGAAGPLYPGQVGWWQAAPFPAELAVDRYYPTVMLTHRLNRTFGEEVMIVAGGSDPLNQGTVPFALPLSGVNPRNTWESFRVRASVTTAFLGLDQVLGNRVFAGPGVAIPMSPSDPTDDWLEEYPRMHLLSNGKVFMSGWSPLSSILDPEAPPLVQGGWITTVGRTGLSWPHERHDGSSVFFARSGSLTDVSVRLCGSAKQLLPAPPQEIATRTAEFCLAGVPNAGWGSLGNVSGQTAGRNHSNAAIMPDGSILVAGGEYPIPNTNPQTHVPEMALAIYSPTTGWTSPTNLPSARRYHSTMLVLPNGSVLFGGGEDRSPMDSDYDIYEPAYMHSKLPRPQQIALLNQSQDSDGAYLLTHLQVGISLTSVMQGMAFLDRIVLLAPGSVTHHSDMSARYIELPSVATSTSTMNFGILDEKVMPRGYYMLFAVSNGGIPSEAIWVKIV